MEKEKKTIDYRVEKDSIGTKDVPEGVYYGVQSLRAAENFHITGLSMLRRSSTAWHISRRPLPSPTARWASLIKRLPMRP